MSITELSLESESLLLGELESASRDLSQVRGIVADAVRQLASGFETIAGQSAAQQRLLTETLAKVEAESVTDASVSGFILQSNALVSRVADGLAQAGQRTVDLTESLAQVDVAFGRLVALTNSVRDVSEQIRVLAFNANLEATRARDAGKGFAVVAGAVRDLSSSFREMTEKIRDTVEVARETLVATMQNAQRAAEADGNLARATRVEMGALQAKTDTLQARLAESLHEARQLNGTVNSGVGQCLRGLQFDDLVGQLCDAAVRRIAICQPLISTSGSATTTGTATLQGERLAQLQVLQHRPVQQTSLDAGDIEFF